MNKRVPLDRKLAALQTNDTYRRWNSLDDQRVCILCEHLITGRMIDVWESTRGILHLHCPTAGCASKPRDWFYHGAKHTARARRIHSRAPILGFGYKVKTSS